MDNNKLPATNENAGNPRDVKNSDTQSKSTNYYLIAFFVIAIVVGLIYSAKSAIKVVTKHTPRLGCENLLYTIHFD
tara:strand:- start:130 stop:357 length:228 start_codon:yes stop_codon:yes gene_type:complete